MTQETKSQEVASALTEVSDQEYLEAFSEVKQWADKKRAVRERKDPLKYGTLVWVQSLSNVDSVNQTFQCEFELWIRRELSKSELIEYRNNPNTFQPFFPIVFAQGAQETVNKELVEWNNDKTYCIEYYSEWDSMVTKSLYLFNVIFTEDLELEHFPFDIQHFDIRIQVDWRYMGETDNIYMKHNERWKIDYSACGMGVPNYATSLIGWDFESHPCLQIVGSEDTQDDSVPWGHISHVITLKREWQFYITRVVIILSIISLLTNFAFVFGEDTVADRFGFISTMLLAGVAYVFVVTGYIPPLKYFTWLDFYLYFTFVYVLLVGVEQGVIAIFDDLEWLDGVGNAIDYILLTCNFVLWLVIHVMFYVKAKQAYDMEMKKVFLAKCEIDDEDVVYSMDAREDGGETVTMFDIKPKKDRKFGKRAFVKSVFN